MPDIDRLELEFMKDDRLRKPATKAIESRYYGRHGDPANHVKFSEEQGMDAVNLRTKEIEKLLGPELDNWILWGKNRSFMPTSFKSQMGTLYRMANASAGGPKIDDGAAAKMERTVNALPKRHREAFIMHHLDRAVKRGYVIRISNRSLSERASMMGVGIRQLQRLVCEAHIIVARSISKGSA